MVSCTVHYHVCVYAFLCVSLCVRMFVRDMVAASGHDGVLCAAKHPFSKPWAH